MGANEMAGLDERSCGINTVSATSGVSPYATGGGGFSFERKAGAVYLSCLLRGGGAPEFGDGRSVVSVAFQQAPEFPIDDIVVSAALKDESEPSLVLSVSARGSPRIVASNESTQKLVRDLVHAVTTAPVEGPERRWGLLVSGPQQHAKQLKKLAYHAAVQMDAPGFFELIRTPGKFEAGIRGRLDQIEALVERALVDLGVDQSDRLAVQQTVWLMLSRLTVLMPRLEPPDETDWGEVANSLIPVARNGDLSGASQLRDRLFVLAGEYASKAARVNRSILRRDVHALLDTAERSCRQGWQALEHLSSGALSAVRDEVTSGDGVRRLRLDRRSAVAELQEAVKDGGAVIVTGASGVGKSALALVSLTAAANADPETLQVLGVNLRHIPLLTVEFETALGCPLTAVLSDLSAPQRVLVVDGADAVNEGRENAFRYLVDAAHGSDVKVIAVTTLESQQVVRDIVSNRFGTEVREFTVGLLTDDELEDVVGTFAELAELSANPRSRELLRRLVVVDLLVRGGVSGVPLNDADAMDQVWSGLVCRRGADGRGSPEAREFVFLRLADLELRRANSLGYVGGMDQIALDGLRRDGLLRRSADDPFRIGPEFAHDELRRYATARLLLAEDDPTSRLTEAGGPRWALGAALLACQALLALPDSAARPLKGRFAALEAAFESLAGEGYSPRWADVPTEALLRLSDPGPVLRDAWPKLCADDGAGLRRLARLVDQQFRDEQGVVKSADLEPIVELLLEEAAPWWSGDHAQQLLRNWLQGHIVDGTPAGHELRTRLRKRLVSACREADRRLAERKAEAARRASEPQDEREQFFRLMERTVPLFTETGFGGRRRRDRPEVPREITDEIVIELLALVGPDLGDDGEGILLRVAKDAPWQLAPAVERFFTSRALAEYRPVVLALLTEAYYLDDEATGGDILDDGIRRHEFLGIGIPQAAWYRGPFWSLFEADLREGVGVLNRLLNHASLIRARTLAGSNEMNPTSSDPPNAFAHDLGVTGTRKTYIGDDHVWIWYRGTGVGPYPCISALQALERFCDQVVSAGVSLRLVVSVLLNGCQSLAMVGLVMGLLVRHIDKAGHLVDPYFTEPLIWELEFRRVTQETSGLAAHTEGLAALDRRKWSLRDAAMYLGTVADTERAAQLRSLGEALVANARSHVESGLDQGATATEAIDQQLAQVRLWASSLDRESYRAWEADENVYIQANPPEDVVEALKPDAEDNERFQQEMRLYSRYHFQTQSGGTQAVGPEELAADLSAAERLLEQPSSFGAYGPWDVPALVAATSLEAHILDGVPLPADALAFATDTVLRISEGEAWPRPLEAEVSLFEQGADRSAARVLPLLLLPAVAPLRAAIDATDADVNSARISAAGLNLARAISYEVRLHLARGLDHVWATPCTNDGECHHKTALRLTIETMRDCVLGDPTPEGQRRRFVVLDEPLSEALAGTPDNLIFFPRLDAAIRSLAPATMANICVSTQARGLVMILLAAQRRSLLSYEQMIDERSTHSLVGARALLTLAEHGDDTALYDHLDAYADNSELLGKLLRALSAAAEETPRRAATASRIWPKVIRHVLQLDNTGHTPFRGHHSGDLTRAALIPNPTFETAYLYREVRDTPIVWWKPLAWQPDIEAWLEGAKAKPQCVDQLVGFVGSLEPEDQASTALPWVSTLVLADPARIARRTFLLPDWLIEIRTAALAADLRDLWQRVVDALVVNGETQLAPYSV